MPAKLRKQHRKPCVITPPHFAALSPSRPRTSKSAISFTLRNPLRELSEPRGVGWSCQHQLRNTVLSHNRITHDLSLAQHPIPSPSFTRHPRRSTGLFTPRFQRRNRAQVRLRGGKSNRAVMPSQRKFPPDFTGLRRCCLLTQF